MDIVDKCSANWIMCNSVTINNTLDSKTLRRDEFCDVYPWHFRTRAIGHTLLSCPVLGCSV